MSRPKVPIDKDQFEKLCAMQCTIYEVAGFFECTHDTIENYVKRTYGPNMTFRRVFNQKRSRGLISLRRNQFKMSEHNPTMAIWLGKQYLNQKDLLMINTNDEQPDDPFTASIKESAGIKDEEE